MQIVGRVMVHISHAVCHALCHPFVLSIDIDECLFMTPCSQQCHNSNGSYYCSCIDGFVTDGPYSVLIAQVNCSCYVTVTHTMCVSLSQMVRHGYCILSYELATHINW